MAYRRIVYGYYNRARKVNHKNKNPSHCAQHNILNRNYASKGKLKQLLSEVDLE